MKTLREWLDRKPAGRKPRKRIQRHVRPKRVSARKRRRDEDYHVLRARYLIEHPFCQITIARLGFSEERVLAKARGLDATNCEGIYFEGQLIPIATQIHHRNKRLGRRQNDARFWLAAAPGPHEWVEGDKAAARAAGYLLPLEADEDGVLPDGTACDETPAFMQKKVLSRRPE